MPSVRGEIVIGRPPGDVFDVVADERNEPRFNPRMVRAEKLTGGPIAAGTRFRAELAAMGRRMPMTVELTQVDRPYRLASVTRSSMMETEGALAFEAVPGGTRMRWAWEVRPRGAMRLMTPLVGVVGRRQERRIWSGLKRLLEEPPG